MTFPHGRPEMASVAALVRPLVAASHGCHGRGLPRGAWFIFIDHAPSRAPSAPGVPRATMADLFDGIVMAEQRFHGEGYQEGLAEGSLAGMAEGRRHGALHGARMGSEIGCYLGFALTWHCLLQKCTDEKNSKKIRALDSLIGMIQKFPYEDATYDKLQEDLEKIRGKFKQIFLWEKME
uniref:LTO1 maturation factor of ABCE1 n=1 Tax=Serinus canaria TaxID=9135 RepID=A0A8C9UCP6_SERCA